MQNILRQISLEDTHSSHHHKERFSQRKTHTFSAEHLLKKYLAHIHTLVLGLLGYAGVLSIIFFVEPAKIKHVLLPNSFSPLLFVFGLANFFVWSFIFLHSRRGFFAAVFLTTLLFLKLQTVLSVSFALWIAGIFCIIESVLTFATRK